jgi:Mg2+/Co2+ transporter CorB
MNVISIQWPGLGLAWTTAFLTVFTLVFGELLPKSFALANAELFSRKVAPHLFTSHTRILMRNFTSLDHPSYCSPVEAAVPYHKVISRG